MSISMPKSTTLDTDRSADRDAAPDRSHEPRRDPDARDVRRVVAGVSLWLLASAALAASGLLTIDRRAFVPIAVVLAVASLVVGYRAGGAVRRVADAIPLRALVLAHAARAPIGVGFFVLAAEGLDATFVHAAGWGDLAVGLLAPLASLALPALDPRRARAVTAWNALGALDIAVAFFTAQRALLFSAHPESMAPLLRFPGPLLPLVIVPLVVTTHALVAVRLWRGEHT